jgi:hypothetical protein
VTNIGSTCEKFILQLLLHDNQTNRLYHKLDNIWKYATASGSHWPDLMSSMSLLAILLFFCSLQSIPSARGWALHKKCLLLLEKKSVCFSRKKLIQKKAKLLRFFITILWQEKGVEIDSTSETVVARNKILINDLMARIGKNLFFIWRSKIPNSMMKFPPIDLVVALPLAYWITTTLKSGYTHNNPMRPRERMASRKWWS